VDPKARCPRCDASIKHLQIEFLPIHEDSRVLRKGIVLLCAHCNTVLGAGLDPDAAITEIEIPAKMEAHPAAIALEISNTPTAAQTEPENTARKRQINWPIIRAQQELFEHAELQHKGMKTYPLQGKPVGEILLHYGVIDENTLRVVRDMQKRPSHKNRPIGEILVEVGIIQQDELTHTLLIQAGIPMVDVLSIDIPPEISKAVPLAKTREKLAIPIGHYRDTLYLAVSDPFTFADQSFFTVMTGEKVKPVFAPMHEITSYLDTMF